MGARSQLSHGEDGHSRGFALFAYAVQFFFGGWFFYNGLNYFAEFTPPPPGSSPLARELIGALEHTGLFAVVKAVELVTGALLLANRLVPLALIVAAPVALAIVWVMLVMNGGAVGASVGVLVILFGAVMIWARLGSFLPVLVWDDTASRARAFPMRMPWIAPAAHVLAVVLGIAAPVAIEIGTMAYFQAVAKASTTAEESKRTR